MAQNVFQREESDPLPTKLKKKKKKKISPLKRKDEEEEGFNTGAKKSLDDPLDFNPYLLEDESISKLESPESKPKKLPANKSKRRK